MVISARASPDHSGEMHGRSFASNLPLSTQGSFNRRYLQVTCASGRSGLPHALACLTMATTQVLGGWNGLLQSSEVGRFMLDLLVSFNVWEAAIAPVCS